MREILFRGKRVDNGEWAYGDLIRNEDLRFPMVLIGGLVISRDKYTDKPSFDGYELYEIIQETIGQYTGLTDKNGTKIFEGDIVKKSWIYRYETGRGEEKKLNSFTGVVIFDRGQFGLSLDENMDFDEFIGENKSDKWTEVIGNIHDNKELLGGYK